MKRPNRQAIKTFVYGGSLRHRIAYSLAIVRLILVPVFFLALYYLFRMGWIVDRIVRVDAPVATLADQISIQMLEARRAERNYFLLHDPAYVERCRASLSSIEQNVLRIRDLGPREQPAAQQVLDDLNLYRRQFTVAVSLLGETQEAPLRRLQKVIRAYEGDLNNLLAQAGRMRRADLIEDLRSRVASFDVEISKTVGTEDPAMRQVVADLQASSQQVLNLASGIQKRSWERVQQQHQDGRQLLYRAGWVLGIASGVTLLLSIWISFILPRQVVKPLINLKEAVDHAATGNYIVELDVHGDTEVAQLAQSVHRLIVHARDKA